MKHTSLFKPLDITAIVLGIVAAVFISVKVYSNQSGTLFAHITGPGGEWIEPLDKDKEIDVEGPLGITKVKIAGGAASVIDSPCANKLCISQGAASKPNQWIACLPNKVFVKIEGRTPSKDQPDASTF